MAPGGRGILGPSQRRLDLPGVVAGVAVEVRLELAGLGVVLRDLGRQIGSATAPRGPLIRFHAAPSIARISVATTATITP